MRKLSDIKGEEVFDVLAELIEPVADIAADPKTAGMFRGEKRKGEDNKAYTLRSIKTNLPHLLKAHKRSLITIFAALDGKTAEEYVSRMNLLTLPASVIDMLNDDALMELFTSAASTKAGLSAAIASAAGLDQPECSCATAQAGS